MTRLIDLAGLLAGFAAGLTTAHLAWTAGHRLAPHRPRKDHR
jgi:hypothetical protein